MDEYAIITTLANSKFAERDSLYWIKAVYSMNQSPEYDFWGKSWQKWLVFAGAVLQIIGLYLNVRDFQDVGRLEIRTKLFSEAEWISYAAGQYFQFSISAVLILLFLGCFIIGLFSRSKKTSDFSIGILLIISTLFWCVIGFAIPVFTVNSMRILWFLLLIAGVCGGVYQIWTSRRL